MLKWLLPLPAHGLRRLEPVAMVASFALSFIAALIVWHACDERERMLEEEYRVLEVQSRIADSELIAQVGRIKQLLQRIAEEQANLPLQEAAVYDAALAERKHDYPEVRTLAIVNVDGLVIASSNPEVIGFDAARRDYFTAHRQPRHEGVPHDASFHITRPFLSYFGDTAIVLSTPVRDAGKHFLGVVIASVKPSFFADATAKIRPPGNGGAAAILNQDGDLLYRLPKQAAAAGSDGRLVPAGAGSLVAGKQRLALNDGDGSKRLHAYRAISDVGLGIATSTPLSVALAQWRHNVILGVLVVIIFSAITLSLVYVAHLRQRRAVSSQAFAARLIETANVMVVGLNARGEVAVFNEAAEKITGFRRDEVFGCPWFDKHMPRWHDEPTWLMLRAACSGGELPPAVEYPIFTRDGQLRLIAWRNSPVPDDETSIATISFGIDITERAQMEAIRRSAKISRHLVSIQEEERRRLAVELHDRTSPNLSALEINWKLIAESVNGKIPDDASHLLDDASALLDDTIESIRAISTEFRPPVLDHAGFWPGIEGYSQHFSRRTGITVEAERMEMPVCLPPEIETPLFRIVQEALANCARHAQAKKVSIGYALRGDCIRLTIADDGTGFDPDRPPGRGLLTMRKRAEFIGGRFILETCPGKGTRIAVEFPATGHSRLAEMWDDYSV